MLAKNRANYFLKLLDFLSFYSNYIHKLYTKNIKNLTLFLKDYNKRVKINFLALF